MPGAGSLVAANYLANVAARDGTVIGGVNALLATDPLLYPERVRFDPRQFRWIGSALRETHVGRGVAHRAGQDLRRSVPERAAGRRQRRLDQSLSGVRERHHGRAHQDDPGLPGHPQRHAGDGARRGLRQFRHHLGEPQGHQRQLAARGQDQGLRADRAQAPRRAAGRAPGSTTTPAAPTTAPPWTWCSAARSSGGPT